METCALYQGICFGGVREELGSSAPEGVHIHKKLRTCKTAMQHRASSDSNSPVTNTQRMTTVGFCYSYMWQSRVENEHYSIVYYVHITTFEAEVPLKAGLLCAVQILMFSQWVCVGRGKWKGGGREEL